MTNPAASVGASRWAPLVLLVLAGSAWAQAAKLASATPWKVERDEEGLLVTLRAASLRGGSAAKRKAADYPTLALTCDQGRTSAFVYADYWEKKAFLMATFDDEVPVSFGTTDRVGALYVNPSALLARLQGRRRLQVEHGDAEVATFLLEGSDAALAQLSKECPLPDARPPRKPLATPSAWAMYESVSSSGEEGVGLDNSGSGGRLTVSCGKTPSIYFADLKAKGLVGVVLIDNEKPLTLQLDDGAAETIADAKWHGSWLFLADPPHWLARFERHDRVTLGYNVTGQAAPQAIRFELKGLAAALQPYRSMCGPPAAREGPPR
jgi:hypothetical protein